MYCLNFYVTHTQCSLLHLLVLGCSTSACLCSVVTVRLSTSQVPKWPRHPAHHSLLHTLAHLTIPPSPVPHFPKRSTTENPPPFCRGGLSPQSSYIPLPVYIFLRSFCVFPPPPRSHACTDRGCPNLCPACMAPAEEIVRCKLVKDKHLKNLAHRSADDLHGLAMLCYAKMCTPRGSHLRFHFRHVL